MNNLTQDALKNILAYNPLSGVFSRKDSRSNGSHIGSEAGNINSVDGYRYIRVNRKNYKAHRLAFLFMTGSFPQKDVDHINHIRHDNRWNNLREVSRRDNTKNATMQKNNRSGITGVCWHKGEKRWRVQINDKGIRKHFGYFDSLEDAKAVAIQKYKELGFHENHGKKANISEVEK